MPPGVVTQIWPLVPPTGAATVKPLAVLLVMAPAAVPLKVTAVAPFKSVPLTVTTVPAGPPAGVKLLMTGTGQAVGKKNTPALVSRMPCEMLGSVSRSRRPRTLFCTAAKVRVRFIGAAWLAGSVPANVLMTVQVVRLPDVSTSSV